MTSRRPRLHIELDDRELALVREHSLEPETAGPMAAFNRLYRKPLLSALPESVHLRITDVQSVETALQPAPGDNPEHAYMVISGRLPSYDFWGWVGGRNGIASHAPASRATHEQTSRAAFSPRRPKKEPVARDRYESAIAALRKYVGDTVTVLVTAIAADACVV